MSSRKAAMDVDPMTCAPSDTSNDLMQMIDDANRAAAVAEKEQWTFRG
jgi:hypothetical protein